jgi:(2R)-sulfolactate sulfo-lyase subunit alpha
VIQFLVHDASHDNVGVAVVDIKAGQEVQGRDLVTNKTLKAKANMDIPLGHKIALKDFKAGDTVMKYGLRHRQGRRQHQERRPRPRPQRQNKTLGLICGLTASNVREPSGSAAVL